jgi:hypothetical protein
LTADTAEKVRELVFSGGTAFAGLILVFLGAGLASFEAYDFDRRKPVVPKYKKRSQIALFAFISALAAAALALTGYWTPCPIVFYGDLAALAASFITIIYAAVVSVGDIHS